MPGSSSEPHQSAMAATNESTPVSASVTAHRNQHKTPSKQCSALQGQLYNSQQYRTPSTRTQFCRGAMVGALTPRSSDLNTHRATPKLRTPSNGHSGCQRITPNARTPHSIPRNPFDSNLMDRLDGHVFSPNVFAQCSSAEQTPKSFKWTIDELAMIKPVDIEEMPVQSEMQVGADQDLERRAQEVIDAYFAQNVIVPSPWTGSAKKPHILPGTPKAPNEYDSPMVYAQHKLGTGKKLTCRVSLSAGPKTDAVCQTSLSLPPNFDLKKILGEHYTQTSEQTDGGGGPDSLSVSSLRRKLFFHGEENQAPSPVKPNKSCATAVAPGMDYDVSPVVSPAKNKTTPQPKHRPSPIVDTPGSDQFSSSPISSPSKSLTPFLRRCSTEPNLMDSPGFSPIGCGDRMQNGLHTPQLLTPLCRPLQATPSSSKAPGSGVSCRGLESPGMSPIVSMEASYVGSTQTNSRSRKLDLGQKPLVPAELAALHSPRLDFVGPAEQDELSYQAMDTDDQPLPAVPANHNHLTHSEDASHGNVLLSFAAPNNHQFTDIRRRADVDETQFSEENSSQNSSDQDTPQPTYFVSSCQDTGYNTNSLQLTTNNTQELQTTSGCVLSSSHTNLTQQFGSLPFTSSQDTGLELLTDDDSMQLVEDQPKQRKPVVRHIAQSKLTRDDSSAGGCEVFRRARRYLGRSMSMEDCQLPMTSTSHEVKQRLFGAGPYQLESGEASSQQKNMLPSEIAKHVIGQAERDYQRFCSNPAPSDEPQPLNADDFYLVSTDCESVTYHPACKVSLSAEF